MPTLPDMDFDSLAERALNCKERDRDTFYRTSYPIILRQMQRLSFDGSEEDFNNLQVCLILIYSWMGRGVLTSLPEARSHYEVVRNDLRRVRLQDGISLESLERVRDLVNGSTTGASKFLHFLAPDRFAIWDSNVEKGLGGTRRMISPSDYLVYLEWIRGQHISSASVGKVAERFALPMKTPELRVKELLLFIIGVQLNGSGPR